MITLNRITHEEIGTIGFSIVIDSHEDMQAFKELVQRGSNLWPDAPVEIKEFADLVTTGKVLQDYKAQNTSTKKEQCIPHDWVILYRGVNPHKYICTKCSALKPITTF